MKCPLPVIEVVPDSFPPEHGWRDCIKEECAWWIHSDQRCSILVIAAHLVGLVAVGDEILEKMPHEEQFRR